MFNGEGYKSIQDNNGYQKIGTNHLDYKLIFLDKIFWKIYFFDSHPSEMQIQLQTVLFLGYKFFKAVLDLELSMEKSKMEKSIMKEKKTITEMVIQFSLQKFCYQNDFEIYVRF